MTGSVRHHTVRVPATSANMGAGFDSLGLALARHLVVRSGDRSGSSRRVTTRGLGADELPDTDDNLVWRSFVAFCSRYGCDVPDVALDAVNDIPPERGLGSSSSAIVAGIVLAQSLTRHRVPATELVELAAGIEGHPDNVAPALLGGFVACVVADDDRLVVRRTNPVPGTGTLVLVPTTRGVTEAARAVLPESLARTDVAAQAARAGHTVGATTGAWPAEPLAVGDRLHEPARGATMPASAEMLRVLRSDWFTAWLSGAGPSVVALAPPTSPDRSGGPPLQSEHGLLPPTSAHAAEANGFEVQAVAVDLSGAVSCPDGGCAFSGGGECVQCPRNRV